MAEMKAMELIESIIGKLPERDYILVSISVPKVVQLMQEYARIKCQEQREICAKEAGIEATGRYDNPYIADQETIVDAPEPVFD